MRSAPPLLLFRLTIVVGVFVLLPLAGCTSRARRSDTEKTKAAAVAPNPGPQILVLVGEVAVVNDQKHFVLVDLGSNLYLPDPGTPLHVLRDGVPVAQLKASPEQKRPFVAADIVEGTPEVGDRVER